MACLVKVSFVVAGSNGITNCSRVIRHAWHFYYALVLVVRWHAEALVLLASHLNKALCGQTLIIKKDFRREIRRCCSLGANAQRI